LRLLLDEMYAPAVAVELRARGHDVLSVHEADPALVGAADSEVLSAAVSAERVLVTENVRDFRPLEIAILEGAITTTGSSTPATVSSVAARRERPGTSCGRLTRSCVLRRPCATGLSFSPGRPADDPTPLASRPAGSEVEAEAAVRVAARRRV
jgi:hypothetical protein